MTQSQAEQQQQQQRQRQQQQQQQQQGSGISLFGWTVPVPDLNILPDDFDPLNPRDYIPDSVERVVDGAVDTGRRTLRDAWNAVNPYFDQVGAAMGSFAREVEGRFRYRMGAKGQGGFIDCSGFIAMAVDTVTDRLADSGIISRSAASRITALFNNNNSEGQITAMARHGTLLSEQQLRESGLCEGMVLAIDTGQRRHDVGRAMGIDHIAYCFRGADGRLMVAESRSGAGTTTSDAQSWFERYAARGNVIGVRMDEVISNIAGGPAAGMRM